MVESKITSKGRTTIPKSVREALGVKPGDRVRYFIQGDEVRIIPVQPLSRLLGALKYDGPPMTLEEMDDAVEGNFSRIHGALKGTVTNPKDTDLNSPAEADWDAAQ